jgi:hypothetical protein
MAATIAKTEKYVKKTVQKLGCVYLLRSVPHAPVGNRRKTAKSAFVNQTLLKIRHKKGGRKPIASGGRLWGIYALGTKNA